MKKRVLLNVLLFVMVFCMVACGNKEDVGTANSLPTQTEEPTPEPTAAPTPEPTEEPTAAPTQEPDDINDGVQEMTLKLELKVTENPRINEMLNVSGSYTDSVDNEGTFSYQIPQFNADSESAKTVNQRIVDDIYPLVEAEFETMAIKASLLNGFITYDVMEWDNTVSILVMVPYDNDIRAYYTYSYDFVNDKEMTNIELLAMKGMTEESFVETACKMGLEYIEKLFEGTDVDVMEEYKNCIEDAKDATTVDLPMYLDEEGALKVYIPFPSAAGANWYYHLCEF